MCFSNYCYLERFTFNRGHFMIIYMYIRSFCKRTGFADHKYSHDPKKSVLVGVGEIGAFGDSATSKGNYGLCLMPFVLSICYVRLHILTGMSMRAALSPPASLHRASNISLATCPRDVSHRNNNIWAKAVLIFTTPRMTNVCFTQIAGINCGLNSRIREI